MKKISLAMIFLGASVAFASAPSLAQKVEFKPITKQGLSANYTDKATLDLMGQKVEYLSDANQTVTKVAANGDVTITEKDTNVSVMMAGNPVPAPPSASTSSTMDKIGRLKSFSSGSEADSSSQARMFNLTVFILPQKPIEIGGTWQATVPAVKSLGTVPLTAKYTVVKVTKVGVFPAIEVKFEIHETSGTPMASSTGTMWIDGKTGMTDKIDATLTNASLPGVSGPINGTISVVRKS